MPFIASPFASCRDRVCPVPFASYFVPATETHVVTYVLADGTTLRGLSVTTYTATSNGGFSSATVIQTMAGVPLVIPIHLIN